MIIDILFPRLIFNLTLAFRALMEKQSSLKTLDAEAGHVLYLALGLVLPEGAWGWVLVVSLLTLQVLAALGQDGSTTSSVLVNANPP